jgi:molecular chaperone GrpE
MPRSADKPLEDDPADDIAAEDPLADPSTDGDDADPTEPVTTGTAEPSAAAPAQAANQQRAVDDQRDRYLRLAAEYDNFRKRTTRERSEIGSRAQAELARQLLDALDDLSRFAHLDPAATDAATVVQGADLVEKKLRKALGAAGLETIDPIDQPFDPAVHEAVVTEAALSPEDDHMVARVFQLGYRFNGQLLRPARVVVKQWTG